MIKLTKKIDGKEVELDVISLGGKSVIRKSCFKQLAKRGITRSILKDAGFGIEEIKVEKIE